MKLSDLLQLDEAYQMPGLHHYPLAPERGEGSYLYDADGFPYLDFSCAMGKTCIGYANNTWSEAILDQALLLSCSAPQYYTEQSIRLAEELCYRSGMASACFTPSGREAERLMIQLARRYSKKNYSAERNRILTLQGGMRPLPPDLLAVRSDMDAIRAAATPDVCAVLLSLFPEDDLAPLPRHFVHELAVFCAEQNWLLLVDECQTGAGRFGSLFAYLQYGFVPDLLSFSEAMAGGLPLGGILTGNRCRMLLQGEDLERLSLGANPICAAAALAILEILNEDILAQAKEKGDYLRCGIEELSLRRPLQVGGTGLMVTLACMDRVEPRILAERLALYGLICSAGNERLLLLPPLTATKAELDHALRLIQEAFGHMERDEFGEGV